MSADRLRTGDLPGIDCPAEITFAEFLAECRIQPIVRAQGKIEDATKSTGRLVRFNRSVRVLVNTASTNARGEPYVIAQRVQWNWRINRYVDVKRPDGTLWRHTLTWAQLDWITWQASGDPNGSWIKVTHAR